MTGGDSGTRMSPSGICGISLTMKRTFASTIASALVATSLLTTACLCPAQGLLFSESFEYAPTEPPPTQLGDWTLTGGAVTEKGTGTLRRFNALDQTYALFAPLPSVPWSSGASRTVASTPGYEYRWSGHILNDSDVAVGDGVHGLALIQFLGPGGTPISSFETQVSPAQDVWTDFSVTGTAPAGTESVLFLINAVAPEGGNASGGYYFDLVQAEITGVPEPTALWAIPVLVFAAAASHLRGFRKARQ